jgi:hypothetical protein
VARIISLAVAGLIIAMNSLVPSLPLLALLALAGHALACTRIVPNGAVLRRTESGRVLWAPSLDAAEADFADAAVLPCHPEPAPLARNATTRKVGLMTPTGSNRQTTTVEFPYVGADPITLFSSTMEVPTLPTHTPPPPICFWPGLEVRRRAAVQLLWL